MTDDRVGGGGLGGGNLLLPAGKWVGRRVSGVEERDGEGRRRDGAEKAGRGGCWSPAAFQAAGGGRLGWWRGGRPGTGEEEERRGRMAASGAAAGAAW